MRITLHSNSIIRKGSFSYLILGGLLQDFKNLLIYECIYFIIDFITLLQNKFKSEIMTTIDNINDDVNSLC